MSGGFRLSSAFPHPRRMKSAPPEGDPGAWIRNFVGGALRTVVYKLQNKTVLEWKPRLSFPTQEEGMGVWGPRSSCFNVQFEECRRFAGKGA